MLTNKIKRAIFELKRLDPNKLVLFGSYARNHQNKDSDIDILFIKESFLESRIIDRIRNIYNKINVNGIDIIAYTPSEIKQRLRFNDFFLRESLKEGIVLYEKKN